MRNQSAAYTLDDQLKDEYSITLYGQKYPLMSQSFKGFSNKTTKAGKARFNKLFRACDADKREYIKQVSQILNLSTQKTDVGDDTKKKFHVDVDSNANKQAPLVGKKEELPLDQVPDSIAVFRKLADESKQNQSQDDEPEDTTEEKKKALEDEREKDQQQKDREALQTLLQNKKDPNPDPTKNRVVPEMSKGGYLKGKSHKQGGIPMKMKNTLNGHPVADIEVEDGEYIINKESTKHFKNELEAINRAGNELRDSKGTSQENDKRARLEQLKKKLQQRRMFMYGGDPGGGGSKGEVKEQGQLVKEDFVKSFNKFADDYWIGKSQPKSRVAKRDGKYTFPTKMLKFTNYGMPEAAIMKMIDTKDKKEYGSQKTTLLGLLEQKIDEKQMKEDMEADEIALKLPDVSNKSPPSLRVNKAQAQYVNAQGNFAPVPPPKQANAAPGKSPPAPPGKGPPPRPPGAAAAAAAPRPTNPPEPQQLQPANTQAVGNVNAGAFARSGDDGIRDQSKYFPGAFNKYAKGKGDFSVMVNKFKKTRHKDVESMSESELLNEARGLASNIGATMPSYNGIEELKEIYYELLALDAFKQRAGDSEKKVAAVVDIRDQFGAGAEVDKTKLAQKFAAGGSVQQTLSNLMNDPDEREAIVNQGFTMKKPEAMKDFNDYKQMSSDGGDSYSGSNNIKTFKRKTFDLQAAMMNVERNRSLRHAEEIDTIKAEFGGNLFIKRHQEKNREPRRNLLDRLKPIKS